MACKAIFQLLLICTCLQVTLFAQPIVDALGLQKKQEWNITGYITYIEDSNNLDKRDILSVPETEWISNQGNLNFHKSFSPNPYWIRFRIKNSDSASNHYIQLSNKGINRTILYKLSGDTLVSLGETGDQYPFIKRPYPSTYFTFPIRIPKDIIHTYFLYCNKINENLNLKINLIPEDVLKKQELKANTYIGLFSGILLMAFIVSLMMLSIFKDKLNFWYGIYIISVFNMLLVYDGLDFQWIYPNYPAYADMSRYIASSLILGLMMHVMQLFCNQTLFNSKFYRGVEICKYAIFLMIPLTVFVYMQTPSANIKQFHFRFFLLEQITGVFLVIASCIEKIIQRYKPAIFYLSAVILLLWSGVSGILLETGYINKSTDTPNLLQLSFVIEVVLISIGLLFKYELVKRSNQMLSTELSDLKLSSIKQILQIQRQEQMRIAEDLHDLLGAKLAAVKFKVSTLETKENSKHEIMTVIDEISQSTRTIAHNLRPPELDQHDLSDVINLYINKLNSEQAIKFDFIQMGQPRKLGSDLELSMYKIITELITNILVHAEATESTVQINFNEENIELLVEDNGKGIGENTKEGMGLQNIRKRVAALHGKLHMDTTQGNTIFIIHFPYQI